MRIFLASSLALFSLWFIGLRFVSLVDLLDDLSYGFIYLSVAQDFLCGIHKKHIQATFDGQVVLLSSIAFPYPSLEEIAFYGSLEEFLWDRYHNAVDFVACALEEKKAHSGHIAVLSFGKKHRNAGLAAQSFFLLKSIAGLSFHVRDYS